MAYIGVYTHEMLHRQALELDIEIRLRDVPQEDVIDETVDYSRVVSLAQTLGSRRVALIETFARSLAEQLLAQSPRIRRGAAAPGSGLPVTPLSR